jgi:hypothetical protein
MMIRCQLPLFNQQDYDNLHATANLLDEIRKALRDPDDHRSAVLARALRGLARRLMNVLESAANTKYTLQVYYVGELYDWNDPDSGWHQVPGAVVSPEGYINCNIDLPYIEEQNDLTFRVLPAWEDAGIPFDCYSQGGGGDMYIITDPSRAEEAREIARQHRSELEQWYRDETGEHREARHASLRQALEEITRRYETKIDS